MRHTPRYAGDPANLAPARTDLGDIDENGRLVGVDGIIDQIGEGLRRQAEPLIRDMILPYVSRDAELQARVGASAGDALARQLKPWVILAAGSLAVLAVVQVAKMNRKRGRR